MVVTTDVNGITTCRVRLRRVQHDNELMKRPTMVTGTELVKRLHRLADSSEGIEAGKKESRATVAPRQELLSAVRRTDNLRKDQSVDITTTNAVHCDRKNSDSS